MNLQLESAHVGGLQVAGGGNGLTVARFGWHKAIRAQRRPRPRAHGSVNLTRFYEGRLYQLAGFLHGISETDAQARLDAFEAALALDDGEPVLLKWRLAGRVEDEQAEVKVEGDLDYAFDSAQPTLVRWALSLFAADPRRYGATERSGAYDPSTSSNQVGVPFPLVFPLVFTGEATTHLEVTNAGNFPTPPVFTVEGPVTNPIIDNDTTGESITTENLALLAGDTIVIDVAARSLTLGGTPRPDLIDADHTEWFDLQPGLNQLRLRGGGLSLGSTELSVSFHDARI